MRKKFIACLVTIFLLFLIILSPRSSAQAAEPGMVNLSVQTHVENIGWQAPVGNNAIAGTTGQTLRAEAIKINLVNPLPGMTVQYQAHVENQGWQNWVSAGQTAGTTGQGLRMEAIRIKLVGAPAGYHLQYQAHVQNIGWQGWVGDGAIAGTTGQSLRMEALKIDIVKDVDLQYQAHAEKYGWQEPVNNRQSAGTTGQSLRLEAVKIYLMNPLPSMTVQYQAHVENQGWQGWVSDGQVAGTTGQGLRMEAIRIKLVGAPAGYHIQYQAHVQGIGWQNTVQDGAIAGTTGQSLRLEALRIKVVNNNDHTYARTVMIDPGHGGSEPGAVGNGIQEKNLNMQLSDSIRQKLINDHINVTMTRQDDKAVSLSERTDYANSAEPNLFLSIHHDSSDDPNANGISTHYSTYRPGIDTSDAYVLYQGQSYKFISEGNGGYYIDYQGTKKFVSNTEALVLDPTPDRSAQLSADLAKQLAESLASLGFANGGSRDHDLYVTRWTNTPSVLVEAGFISNPTEAQRVSAPKMIEMMAQKIADTIKTFFGW